MSKLLHIFIRILKYTAGKEFRGEEDGRNL